MRLYSVSSLESECVGGWEEILLGVVIVMESTNVESCVLTQFFDSIVDSSIDPLQLARKLNANGLITDSFYANITDSLTGKSSSDRLSELIKYLRDITKTDKSIFKSFLSVLEEMGGIYCIGLAKKLSAVYEGTPCI